MTVEDVAKEAMLLLDAIADPSKGSIWRKNMAEFLYTLQEAEIINITTLEQAILIWKIVEYCNDREDLPVPENIRL